MVRSSACACSGRSKEAVVVVEEEEVVVVVVVVVEEEGEEEGEGDCKVLKNRTSQKG